MTVRTGPVVVVSPHLDDAVLSAWLVLSSVPARVVTCFAGVPNGSAGGAWDSPISGLTGRAGVELRRAEDLRALQFTGSEAVHLDMLDVQYRPTSDPPGLVEALASSLRPHLEDAGEVWLPAAVGGHVDHALTTRACLSASKDLRCGRFVYADLPYAGQPAWPVEITGGVRDAAVHLATKVTRTPTPSSMWRSALTAVPGISADVARVQRLTPSQRRNKWRALREYRSQLPPLRCGARNIARRRRIFAYEVFWPLRALDGG
jgi:LmbE family N-acetylglucosaminyl deacetylase